MGTMAFPTASAAQSDEQGPVLTLQVENDFFSRFTNTDRHYTSGLRASWMSAPLQVPSWITDIADLPSVFSPPGLKPVSRRVGLSVGQSLFTPDDTDREDLILDDRPYAGWLYVGLALQSVFAKENGASRQDIWQLDLGIVGPAAQGEQVQNNFHDLITVARSNGWDNQLDNEPGINLTFERKWRTQSFPISSDLGLEADIIPFVGAAAGNVMSYISTGAMIRVGAELQKDFGPPRIRPGLPGSETFSNDGGFGWYVFVGSELQAVARSIFLDGNNFTDSHSVSRRHMVGDFQIGAAVVFKRMRLAYTHVFRTPEFEAQSQFDQFGAVSLSWAF
jgi:hypothetical protein